MNRLEQALGQALEVLEAADVAYALVGGLAVSARTEPRFTRDVDLAVACDDDVSAEAVVRCFLDRGYELDALVEQEAVGRLATARLLPPDGTVEGVVVDLLFASSGIEPEIVAGSEQLEIFPDRRVRVARLSHLLALKILSRDDATRPQDAADIRSLAERATSGELSGVEELLAMIEDRGFSRGRDLAADWESIRGSLPGPASGP